MCNTNVVTPPLTFSVLMFHPSAPPLSDNLFEAAHQALVRTELLPNLPKPKIVGPAHSHISEDDFGYMAKSHTLQDLAREPVLVVVGALSQRTEMIE